MFLEMLDEVLLKSFALVIRLAHIFNSLFIVGAVGQFLSDVSGTESPVPQSYVAVVAIACAAVFWSAFSWLFTCCAGYILLQVDIIFDILFAGAFIACIALLNVDSTNTCPLFSKKYLLYGDSWNQLRDCRLIKASYAFSIINLFLFVVTIAVSAAIYMIQRNGDSSHHHRHEKRHSRHHCHHECCENT